MPTGEVSPRQAKARQTLMVSPLRLSSQVAQVGQRLTVRLDATNTSKRAGHGVVMLNYLEHLVSFIALHMIGGESMVQLPVAAMGTTKVSYQLLWSHWPVWAPGERRTAIIALVPRLAQDITFHLSVIFDEASTPTLSQRWSSVVRIPFQAAALADPRYRTLYSPQPVTGE